MWAYLNRCLPGKDPGHEGLSPAWTQTAGSNPTKKDIFFFRFIYCGEVISVSKNHINQSLFKKGKSTS